MERDVAVERLEEKLQRAGTFSYGDVILKIIGEILLLIARRLAK